MTVCFVENKKCYVRAKITVRQYLGDFDDDLFRMRDLTSYQLGENSLS